MSFGFGFGFPKRLTSGGGLSPSLYLDFVGTGVLPGTVTFSRGTNATLTGSNGLIQYAPHNLLTNSEDFEAAAWTKDRVNVASNNVVAPDGTTTADKVTDTAAGANTYRIYNSVTLVAQPYTMTVYAKAAEYSWCYLRIGNALRAWYNLANGTVGTVDAGLTASVSDAGNGWYRLTCTIATATAGAGFGLVGLATGNGVESYTPTTGGMGIFIWGAQLNVGALQSYNPTTPKNLLGFTQEPENAAWTKSNSYVQQNLLTWSQDFDNAAWTKANATVTANAATAPDGSITADKVIANTTAAVVHGVQQTVSTTGSAAISFYAKAAEYSFAVVTSSANNYVYFDLANGVVFSTAGTGWSTPTITSVGNGWYRCAAVTSTANTRYDILVSNVGQASGNTAPLFTGDNTSGIFIWGAQLVQGSTAGDYTQTTSAAAPTRYLNWDGTLTGRKLVEDTAISSTHLLLTTTDTTVVAGTRYTSSIYARAAERSWVAVQEGQGTTATAYFNLTSGVVGTVSGTGSPTASIQSVGGGWYRCTISWSAIGVAARLRAYMATGDGVAIYTGDGTSGIYVSDFQLSNSASVDPYVYNPQAAAASAAYYGPRFDYDPVTLAPRGLLIEEQRTNLLTYSEQFDNAAWTNGNSSVTANATTSPDGATTADKLVENTANSEHLVFVSGVGTGQKTVSVYLKAAERTRAYIYFFNATDGAVSTFFDLSAGTVTSGAGTITSVGNGWYRCTLTRTATANDAVYIGSAITSGATAYTGNGTSGIFIWGAQLEAGSFATSYIPTVASQVTRNADSASMLGDNFYTWYNPNQGTTCVETSSIGANSVQFPGVLRFWSGSNNNRFGVYGKPNGAGYGAVMTTAGSNVALLDPISGSTATIINTVSKLAYAYKPDDFAATRNALTVTTDTSGGVAPVNELNIGLYDDRLNGHIRRIGYYNTRLPDSTLQALTV